MPGQHAWQLAMVKKGKSRWDAAEKQRSLAALVWEAKHKNALRERRATQLQRWWRSSMAKRELAVLKLQHALATRTLVRSCYAAAAAAEPLALQACVSCVEAHEDDDVLLDREMLRVRAEVADLQVIVEGASRALRLCDDGQGGTPRCPWGHPLRANSVDAGAVCGSCQRVARRACVAIQCDGHRCTFTACARAAGCAPNALVKVMNDLCTKHEQDNVACKWWEAG